MEAVVASPRQRILFLAAGAYCTVDLAFHYFGLIEPLSSALHLPSSLFFFVAEAVFAVVGIVLVRKLWVVRSPTTLGRGLPLTLVLFLTILFVAFNGLFAAGGFLLKFTGGS
jgi:hypothetical protein